MIEVTAAFVGSGASYEFDLTTSTETALTGGTTKDIGQPDQLPLPNWLWVSDTSRLFLRRITHRYLGLRGTATTANVTTANINAFLTKDVTNWQGSATRVPATDPAN